LELNQPTIGALAIPDELAGALPRRVRLSVKGLTSLVYACALFGLSVALVAWSCAATLRQMKHREELRAEGREATGEITRFWTRGGKWWVSYSFAAEGTSFSGEARVPKRLEDNLGKGLDERSSLSILYLPANPSISYPSAWEQPARQVQAGLIPIIALASLLAVLGIGLLLPFSRDRQLIQEGMPSVGVITKFNRGRARASDSFCYEFRLSDGRAITGVSPCDGAPEIGTNVCVLYLPKNPERNGQYPLQYYRVATRSLTNGQAGSSALRDDSEA
jgi:hypothetical protein